jgi:hypothetical protein
VTGVVGVSPALWYFRSSEHIFDSTQAPVITPKFMLYIVYILHYTKQSTILQKNGGTDTKAMCQTESHFLSDPMSDRKK